MKNNVIFGIVLVLLGLFALGLVNDWLSFDVTMRQVAKFWPLLIVLAGVAVILHEKRTVFNSTSVLLIILAIPFAVYNCTSNVAHEFKKELHDGFDINISEDDNDFTFEEGLDNDTASTSSVGQTFIIEKKPEVTHGKLKISGGASEFLLGESDAKSIFSADTKNSKIPFKVSENVSGNEHDIDFKMKDDNVKIKGSPLKNKVRVFLNPEAIWDIKMELGAGQVIYDLSKFKVEKLKIESGVANVNIKLGDLLDESTVNVESGVAKYKIQVPENVGCEIKMDGAFNSKNFSGFERVKSGLYRSEGFDKAKKKIYLNFENAITSITVDRY